MTRRPTMDSSLSGYIMLTSLAAVIFALILTTDVSAQENGICIFGNANCSCILNARNIDCAERMLETVPEISDESVTYIDLSSNQIQEIFAPDFAGFSSLLTLDLSDNSISQIHDDAFSSLESLMTLFLSENLLSNLGPPHFLILGNLLTLQLEGNPNLTIDHCLFSQVPRLERLSLTDTRVDLSSELTTVDCQSASDGQPFAYTSTLTGLAIGYEGTSSDASHLKAFPRLETLKLNSFTEESFGSMNLSPFRDLTRLVLEGVYVFPKEFLISETVSQLTILSSHFPCLPPLAFAGLRSLQMLILQLNDFNWVDKSALKETTHLTNIRFYSNQITSLPAGLFEEVGNSTFFPKLIINNDDWDCDCRSKWLQQFLSTVRPEKKNIFLKCKNPTMFREKFLESVDLGSCDEDDDSAQDSYEGQCGTNKEEMNKEPGPGDPWTMYRYYIVGGVAVALIVVVLLLIIALRHAYKRHRQKIRAKGQAGQDLETFQRRARRNSCGPGEDYMNDGIDPDEAYENPSQQDANDEALQERIYDNAPTREDEFGLSKVSTSVDDGGYVGSLDFGPPQRSSVSYVNQAPKSPLSAEIARRLAKTSGKI